MRWMVGEGGGMRWMVGGGWDEVDGGGGRGEG